MNLVELYNEIFCSLPGVLLHVLNACGPFVFCYSLNQFKFVKGIKWADGCRQTPGVSLQPHGAACENNIWENIVLIKLFVFVIIWSL